MRRRTLTRVGIAVFIALGVIVALVLIVRSLGDDKVTEEDARGPSSVLPAAVA